VFLSCGPVLTKVDTRSETAVLPVMMMNTPLHLAQATPSCRPGSGERLVTHLHAKLAGCSFEGLGKLFGSWGSLPLPER